MEQKIFEAFYYLSYQKLAAVIIKNVHYSKTVFARSAGHHERSKNIEGSSWYCHWFTAESCEQVFDISWRKQTVLKIET